MSIRKQTEMSAQRNVYGYVNLGIQCKNVDGDEQPEAKNALIFLVVASWDKWLLEAANRLFFY